MAIRNHLRVAVVSQYNQNLSLPPEAFIRLPQVMGLTGMRRATIYERIKTGDFPAPHKITERASAWRVGEIRAWLADPLGWSATSATTESQS